AGPWRAWSGDAATERRGGGDAADVVANLRAELSPLPPQFGETRGRLGRRKLRLLGPDAAHPRFGLHAQIDPGDLVVGGIGDEQLIELSELPHEKIAHRADWKAGCENPSL